MMEKLIILTLCTVCLPALAVGEITFAVAEGEDLPSELPREAYLLNWKILGPFAVPGIEGEPETSPDLEVDMVDPESLAVRDATGVVNWTEVSAEGKGSKVKLENLLTPNTNAVAYAATYVFSESERDAALLLGSDDGVVVWLNGEQVHREDDLRACEIDDDRVPVTLDEGPNLLVLKVMQALRGWEFVARFEDNTGLAADPSGVAAEARDLPGPGEMNARPPKIVNGPYLQHLQRDAVTIMWQTDVPSVGTLTVERDSANTGVMLEEPRRLHEVRVSGLLPDATYTYSVIPRSESEDEGETASGPEYAFQTFAAEPEPFTFVVYGDNRSLPDKHGAVVNRILEDVGDRAAFLLSTGDLIGDGRNLGQWVPEFFGPAQPLIRKLCLYPVLGNHEGNSQFYFMFFDLPGEERWYSFDYLDAHFIGLDSNADMNPGSEQYQWLVKDLVAHRDAAWKVVYLHHPPYTSGPHGGVSESGVPNEKGIRHGRQHLAPLFTSEEVNVVFAGHDHCYERSHYGDVVYVTSGGGGAPLYDQVNADANPGSAIFVKAWHYVEANVDGGTFTWVARDIDGNEIDRYELKK